MILHVEMAIMPLGSTCLPALFFFFLVESRQMGLIDEKKKKRKRKIDVLMVRFYRKPRLARVSLLFEMVISPPLPSRTPHLVRIYPLVSSSVLCLFWKFFFSQ